MRAFLSSKRTLDALNLTSTCQNGSHRDAPPLDPVIQGHKHEEQLDDTTAALLDAPFTSSSSNRYLNTAKLYSVFLGRLTKFSFLFIASAEPPDALGAPGTQDCAASANKRRVMSGVEIRGPSEAISL